MSSEIIAFHNVTKTYSKYQGILKVKNFLDRLKNGQLGKKLVREADHTVLTDVSFSIRCGERVALLGRNGAGKTTTLKLINRVLFPSSGTITVKGKTGGLIEMGAGFEVELTGTDNIYLSAAILGFSREQTDAIYNDIVDISELRHYIDVPLKKYSSGMIVRLGFAIVMATSPDIVLLDEVMAVGDARFRQKSRNLMETYIQDKTLFFVSHSVEPLREFCERALVIEDSRVVFDGGIEDGLACHAEHMEAGTTKHSKTLVRRNVHFGFTERPRIEVDSAILLDSVHEVMDKIRHGDRALLRVHFKEFEATGDLRVTFIVRRTTLNDFTERMTEYSIEIPVERLRSISCILASFSSQNLVPGSYLLDVSPEFVGQSPKTPVAMYTMPIEVVSCGKDFVSGLVDLGFQIEETA